MKDIDVSDAFIYDLTLKDLPALERLILSKTMSTLHKDLEKLPKLKNLNASISSINTISMRDWPSLINLGLPESLTELNLNNLSGLESLELPKNLQSMKLENMRNLNKVKYYGKNTDILEYLEGNKFTEGEEKKTREYGLSKRWLLNKPYAHEVEVYARKLSSFRAFFLVRAYIVNS